MKQKLLKKKTLKHNKMAAKRGVPERNGSGRGTRANAGRGGCAPRKTGKGRTSTSSRRRKK